MSHLAETHSLVLASSLIAEYLTTTTFFFWTTNRNISIAPMMYLNDLPIFSHCAKAPICKKRASHTGRIPRKAVTAQTMITVQHPSKH